MTEATWGGNEPAINWRMSASLENVPRGDSDLAEVTSLEGAVKAWLLLDDSHKAGAVLRPEHGIMIDGAATQVFHAEGIAMLAERLAVAG
jgi:hypothetical protein